MARAIWKGSISFGLVQIPVALLSAENSDELHFHMLDKRDMTRGKPPAPWLQSSGPMELALVFLVGLVLADVLRLTVAHSARDDRDAGRLAFIERPLPRPWRRA